MTTLRNNSCTNNPLRQASENIELLEILEEESTDSDHPPIYLFDFETKNTDTSNLLFDSSLNFMNTLRHNYKSCPNFHSKGFLARAYKRPPLQETLGKTSRKAGNLLINAFGLATSTN